LFCQEERRKRALFPLASVSQHHDSNHDGNEESFVGNEKSPVVASVSLEDANNRKRKRMSKTPSTSRSNTPTTTHSSSKSDFSMVFSSGQSAKLDFAKEKFAVEKERLVKELAVMEMDSATKEREAATKEREAATKEKQVKADLLVKLLEMGKTDDEIERYMKFC